MNVKGESPSFIFMSQVIYTFAGKSEIMFSSQGNIREFDKFEKNQGI